MPRIAPRTSGGTHALLAVPTFGFALAATTVGTYLPVLVADEAGSATAIAALIAVEGVLALFLPVLIGARSDRLRTPIGGRLPFVLAGVPVMAVALVLLGFQDAPAPALAIVIVLFGAYYVAYEPYRALYPDLVPHRDAGRSQSAQAVARGVGTALALVGGGLLLAIDETVPFDVAAGILLATTGAFVWALLRRDYPLQQEPSDAMTAREAFRQVRRLLAELPGLRAFFAANALWEAALGAIRTFVVLWVTVGLGLSLVQTAGVIGAAGVCVLVGAALAGRLAERFGTRRVVRATAITYGAPMIVPFLLRRHLAAPGDDPDHLRERGGHDGAALRHADPDDAEGRTRPADRRLQHEPGGRDRARPAARRRRGAGPGGARHAPRDERLLGPLAGRRAAAARERPAARGHDPPAAVAGGGRPAQGRGVDGSRGPAGDFRNSEGFHDNPFDNAYIALRRSTGGPVRTTAESPVGARVGSEAPAWSQFPAVGGGGGWAAGSAACAPLGAHDFVTKEARLPR